MGDADTGRMKMGRYTLNATPTIVTSVSLPSGTRGVRIRPQGAAGSTVIFAVGEDPVAELAGNFGIGNVAITGESAEVRIPGGGASPDGSGKPMDLRMRSTVASLEVIVETF